jgi:ElaB/YqjD/DUF883 family membrane-anchored ribosome-binding protein
MSRSSENSPRAADQVLAELEAVLAQAEQIIAQAGRGGSDVIGALRDRYELAAARLSALYASTREKVARGAQRTDDAIRENPYTSVGIAIAVGVAAGLLIARGKHPTHD